MCALCSGGWLVARLMSSVSGRRTLRDHLYVFVCERRHLFRTVINSGRYRVRTKRFLVTYGPIYPREPYPGHTDGFSTR